MMGYLAVSGIAVVVLSAVLVMVELVRHWLP